jgi:predicted PurR-regulated permease PerM
MRASLQQTLRDNFIQRTLIVIGLVTAVTLLLFFAWKIADILVLLFAGILLGVFLTSLSGWIRQHTPLSHRQALGITTLLLIGLLVAVGWFAAPNLVAQSEQLSSNLVESIDSVQSTLADQSWAQPILNRLPSAEEIGTSSGSFFNQISNLFSRTFNMFTNIVVILFLGFYLAFEPDVYANGFIKLVPMSYRHRAGEVLDEVAYTLRWWLAGRLASMLIVGVLSMVGLFLLGIPLAFILGVLTGLLAFIPIIGPALALIPPVLIAFTNSPTQALYVVLLYMGIQIIESYFITPLIQRKTVSLPPVLLIISQVIFGVYFNLMGTAIAAPVAAMLMTLTKMLYVKDVLGDGNIKLLKEKPEAHFKEAQTVAEGE